MDDDFVFDVISKLTTKQSADVSQGLANVLQGLFSEQQLARLASELAHGGPAFPLQREVDEGPNDELLVVCREHLWDEALDVLSSSDDIDGSLQDHDGNTALLLATAVDSAGACEVAGELLARYPETVTIANDAGVTPLHVAVLVGSSKHLEAIGTLKALLNLGADIDAITIHTTLGIPASSTALSIAMRAGAYGLADFLLSQGASLANHDVSTSVPTAGMLQLCAAYDPAVIENMHVSMYKLVREGKRDVVCMLLDLGYPLYRLNAIGVSWMHGVSDCKLMSSLLMRGVDLVLIPSHMWEGINPEVQRELGKTYGDDIVSLFALMGLGREKPAAVPLADAVMDNAVDRVVKLVPAEGWVARALYVSIGGRPTTLLHLAVQWRATAVLAYLHHECGPVTCALRGPCARTPLQAAAARNWKEGVEILLSHAREDIVAEAACTAVSHVAWDVLPMLLGRVTDANAVVEAWFAAPVLRMSARMADEIVCRMAASPPLRYQALRTMLESLHAVTLSADIDRVVGALGVQLTTSEAKALPVPPNTSLVTAKLLLTYGTVRPASLGDMLLDATSPGMLKRLLALGASPPMDCCAQCRVRRGEGLSRCSRCKCVVYCNEAHQRQHWHKHSKVCAWWAAEGVATELGSLLQIRAPVGVPASANAGADAGKAARGKKRKKKKKKR